LHIATADRKAERRMLEIDEPAFVSARQGEQQNADTENLSRTSGAASSSSS